MLRSVANGVIGVQHGSYMQYYNVSGAIIGSKLWIIAHGNVGLVLCMQIDKHKSVVCVCVSIMYDRAVQPPNQSI